MNNNEINLEQIKLVNNNQLLELVPNKYKYFSI